MPLASSVGKKTKKSTEDSVIYLLGNPQRDIGDWPTLTNKLDTIATHSIQRLRVNNNKPLPTTRAHAYAHAGQKCRHTEPKKKKDKKPLLNTSMIILLLMRWIGQPCR